MSFSQYDSVKEQIREAIDIVELVSRHVELRRRGATYVGRCPWHDDTRPSLEVNPQRQTFKCWVCDIGGDVFSFVMRMENVDFREALEILADKAGILLPAKKKDSYRIHSFPSQHPGDPDTDNAGETTADDGSNLVSRKTLFQEMQWASERYHEALQQLDEAFPAREYLKERGITEASIRKFQLGYAPLERDWWFKQLKGDTKRIGILEAVGIMLYPRDKTTGEPRRSERPYDRFRGRLLFPIRDTQDRTVAFGGRVLPNSPLQSRAKYVNSPETPLFSKHRMLYGLDIARLAMSKTHRALIMEGYTDCIMAHQHGFTDAVAVLGTAIGAEQIRLLKRHANKMYLILDGDTAGQKRTGEVLELFLAEGADLAVSTLPEGSDPCDFLEKHGAEALQTLLDTESVDALDHAFALATRGIDLQNDIIGSTRALEELLVVIAKIGRIDTQRALRLGKVLQRLSQSFGIDEGQIRRTLKRLRDQHHSRNAGIDTPTRESGGPYPPEAGENGATDEAPTEAFWGDPRLLPDTLEREMLELWLADPTTIYTFWEHLETDELRSPITRTIQETANRLVEREQLPSFENLITAFDDPRMKNFLVELDESGRAKRMVRPAPTVDAAGNAIEHEPVEQPYNEETKERLIREIVEGFRRRRSERQQRLDIGKLKRDDVSKEEKIDTLAALLEQQKRKHKLVDD